MKRPRLVAVIGGTALLVSVPLAARADSPAPPGEAEAVVAQVGDIAAVGHTHAKADQSGTESSGNAVELGGQPPSHQFGGNKKGAGEDHDAFFDSGASSAGRVRVTPWSATNTDDGSTRRAVGEAALLRLVLGDNAATLDVAQSRSEAGHDGMNSYGKASSDGAVANAGGDSGLTVVILHSEASSNGSGKAYVAGVNGTEILSSDQANGQCAVAIPQLISVNCLAVTGGAGSVTAMVAQGVVGDTTSTNLPAAAITASGSGRVAAGAPSTPPPAPAPAPAPAEKAEASGPPAMLPRTGGELWLAAMVGLSLMALGWGLLGVGREWAAAHHPISASPVA